MPSSFHTGSDEGDALVFENAIRFCSGKELAAAAVTADPTNWRLEIFDGFFMLTPRVLIAGKLCGGMNLFSEFDECGHKVAKRRVAWLAEGEIEFLIERVK